MRNNISVVFIDDDTQLLKSLKMYMRMNGIGGGVFFDSWNSAKPHVITENIDILVLDVSMSDISGLEALNEVKKLRPKLPVYMLSGRNEVPLAVKALKSGAEDYLLKPLDWKCFITETLLPMSKRKSTVLNSPHEKITHLREWYMEIMESSFLYDTSQDNKQLWGDLWKVLWDEKYLFSEGVTLGELSNRVNSNTTYLSRFFNEVFSLSFPQWVRKMRIATFVVRFDEKRENSQFTIEGHGLDIGFQSRSSFYSACKSVIGVSPKMFIEKEY